MKTKRNKYPDYVQVSHDGDIYVDVDKWIQSPEREREIEYTEQLRRYLKNEQNINL